MSHGLGDKKIIKTTFKFFKKMSKLFITESENYLSKKYIKDGYIIVDN